MPLDILGHNWTRSSDQTRFVGDAGQSVMVSPESTDVQLIAQINAILTDPEPTRLAALDQTIQGDATIQQLRAMDNTAFDAWWTANVTNLAQASNVLKRLTRLALRRLA